MVGRIVEAGRLEPASLFARFDFPRAALFEAHRHWRLARQQGPAAKPREVATYTHELTHYLQYTTTPYGLFLQWCRVLQNRATINMVQALVEGGCAVAPPLLRNLPPMPPEVAEQVEIYLGTWLNTETMVNSLNGDSERRSDLIAHFCDDMARMDQGLFPLRPPLQGLHPAFLGVQELLAAFIAHTNGTAHQAGNPYPIYPDGIDRAALAREAATELTQEDRSILGTTDLLDVLGGNGNPFGVASIIEGAATAAEYWDTGLPFEEFVARVTAGDAALQLYHAPLLRALDSVRTRDLEEFLLSFGAICELALFAPLLPQHAPLRLLSPGFRQLLPAVRFADILSVAGRVRPMRGRADHLRYLGELCGALGWVPPSELVRHDLQGAELATDPLCHIYWTAQRWRAQVDSTCFLGVDHFLSDASPLGDAWRDSFDFVINDFSDRTTFHRNKDFLRSMTTRSLNMLGMQAIMLADSLVLAAPYASHDGDEKNWMTEWLRGRFTQLFGGDFPELRFE
ncbi:hypothetical protein [Roseomonas sp. BN140053]|uniref:hypothetical protein n=1 Tax=Roseomonas sp. BN140053 TaxID=3391898 RepID=UPI0039E846C1